MPATHSPEGRISTALRNFGCSELAFVKLCKSLAVQISSGGINEALAGKRTFDQQTVEQLFGVLAKMNALQNSIGTIPVDWSRTELISTAIKCEELSNVAGGKDFAELADRATKAVTQ